MEKIQDIASELQNRWADDPATELCLKLIKFMANEPNERLNMLTFRNIQNILNYRSLDDNLVRAVTILVSARIQALEQHMLLIDDDEEAIEIEASDIAEARASGRFVHPSTGEYIDDYESKLVPFYTPSEKFLRLKAGKYE